MNSMSICHELRRIPIYTQSLVNVFTHILHFPHQPAVRQRMQEPEMFELKAKERQRDKRRRS